MQGFHKNIIFIVSLVLLVSLWQLATNFQLINLLFFPNINEFAHAASSLFLEKNFLADIGISTFRVLAAFIIAFALAVPLALYMSISKFAYKLLAPYIDFIRYLPVPALIPLTILFFGIGEMAKIVLLFIGVFFQLILLVLDSLNNVPKQFKHLAYTLKFTHLDTLKMKLAYIAPQLFDNSRIALGWCWTYLVIAELVAANSGIGHVIKEAQRFSDIPRLYVAIATIGVIGFASDALFKKFYPKLFKYKSHL